MHTSKWLSEQIDELKQKPADLGRLLLLDPVARVLNQMNALHMRADVALHAFEHAGRLADAPVGLAGDEARGHVDRAAGKNLQSGTVQRMSPT